MLTRQILEADIVAHCSLRCAHCAVSSPYMKASFWDIASFEKDVHELAKSLHLFQFRLIGGEPLLVPNLMDYVRVSRASGISDWLTMTTNGLLLEKADEELLTSFDMIVVSIYHNIGDARTEKLFRGVAKLIQLEKKGHLKHVVICDTNDFRLSEVDGRIEDEAIVQRIYEECTQKEMCSCVREGYVWRCTGGSRRGAYLQAIGQQNIDKLLDPEIDGCAIHKPDLEERLRVYFSQEIPYEMCYYCLGNSGKSFNHRQLTVEEMKEKRNAKHPSFVDVQDLLLDHKPWDGVPLSVNYTGDKANPRCSKCLMGIIHSECDNDGQVD